MLSTSLSRSLSSTKDVHCSFRIAIEGEGIAICDGKEATICSGDSLLVPPTGTHEIHNNGSKRLYTFTVMVPNEGFVELIRSGVPDKLDAEDLAVLQRKSVL